MAKATTKATKATKTAKTEEKVEMTETPSFEELHKFIDWESYPTPPPPPDKLLADQGEELSKILLSRAPSKAKDVVNGELYFFNRCQYPNAEFPILKNMDLDSAECDIVKDHITVIVENKEKATILQVLDSVPSQYPESYTHPNQQFYWFHVMADGVLGYLSCMQHELVPVRIKKEYQHLFPNMRHDLVNPEEEMVSDKYHAETGK